MTLITHGNKTFRVQTQLVGLASDHQTLERYGLTEVLAFSRSLKIFAHECSTSFFKDVTSTLM